MGCLMLQHRTMQHSRSICCKEITSSHLGFDFLFLQVCTLDIQVVNQTLGQLAFSTHAQT